VEASSTAEIVYTQSSNREASREFLSTVSASTPELPFSDSPANSTMAERELRCTAPLAILYEASTPRMLARALSQSTKEENWQSLVAINRRKDRRSGDRAPLFLVHGAEGNVLLYRSLAAH